MSPFLPFKVSSPLLQLLPISFSSFCPYKMIPSKIFKRIVVPRSKPHNGPHYFATERPFNHHFRCTLPPSSNIDKGRPFRSYLDRPKLKKINSRSSLFHQSAIPPLMVGLNFRERAPISSRLNAIDLYLVVCIFLVS